MMMTASSRWDPGEGGGGRRLHEEADRTADMGVVEEG